MSREAKLAELRAKTDIELVHYVGSELDLGVRLASESNAQSQIRAGAAYDEIVRLLPILHDLGESERRRLQTKLKSLRGMLDLAPALAQAAC
jgi:hypothetical protein